MEYGADTLQLHAEISCDLTLPIIINKSSKSVVLLLCLSFRLSAVEDLVQLYSLATQSLVNSVADLVRNLHVNTDMSLYFIVQKFIATVEI